MIRRVTLDDIERAIAEEAREVWSRRVPTFLPLPDGRRCGAGSGHPESTPLLPLYIFKRKAVQLERMALLGIPVAWTGEEWLIGGTTGTDGRGRRACPRPGM